VPVTALCKPLLLLVLACTLSACGKVSDQYIRFGLASAPVSLDPKMATDAASARVNRLLYRRLVDFDEQSRPVPSLATWSLHGPDRYRFRLGREGRRFHDGTRLTAHDVRATYAAVLDPATASPHRAGLTGIMRMEVIDDDTIDFVIKKPEPGFPGRLVIGIQPAALLAQGHAFNTQPVGSGPFRLLARPDDSRLLLERSADGQVVELLHVPDPTVRALKIARGEIDLVQNDLPSELVGWLEARDDLEVQRGPGSNFSYLGFNLADAVTAKPALRRAIAHALDREAIIAHVMGNSARTAEALLPPDHWAGQPGLEPYAHDPAFARRLLAEAGFDARHPPRLTYKTSSDPFRIRLATVIQHQLGRVGIEVDLRSFDWGTFYGDIKAGRFQMYSLSWVGIKMPDIFRYVFHSASVPPDGANRGRYASAAADRLIDLADAGADADEQAAGYRRLQRLLHEELPYVPLWYEDHVLVTRRGIGGYRLARDGNYDGLVQVRRSPGMLSLAGQ